MTCEACKKEVKSLVDGKCQKCFADDGLVMMTLDGSIDDFKRLLDIRKKLQKGKLDADV